VTLAEAKLLKRGAIVLVCKAEGKGPFHFIGTARVLGVGGTQGCALVQVSTLSKGEKWPVTDGARFKAIYSEISFAFE